MAIEIRQMTIKSTLVSEPQAPPEPDPIDIEALRQSLLEEFREMIEQSLDEMQER